MQFWDAPWAKKPSDSSGGVGRSAATLPHRPFRGCHSSAGSMRCPATAGKAIPSGAAPQAARVSRALPGLDWMILHDLELDLLDLRQPRPLPRQDVIDLFMQMADLELRLQVHPIV